MRFGAGRDETGTVLMLTLGTGIGSALFRDGVLVPNTEFGHLQMRGKDAEKRAAASIKVQQGPQLARLEQALAEYLDAIDALLWPDLVIIGGGISKEAAQFIPELPARLKLRAGDAPEPAGIVGAAMLATEAAQLTRAARLCGRRLVPRPGAGSPARSAARRDGYRPIESYGLIGDLRTAALVGRDGTIDWFCPERFDAPSLFAAILDAELGGSFRSGRPATRSRPSSCTCRARRCW